MLPPASVFVPGKRLLLPPLHSCPSPPRRRWSPVPGSKASRTCAFDFQRHQRLLVGSSTPFHSPSLDARAIMAACSCSVHISEASGPNAFKIKGHFDSTGEISCGKPVCVTSSLSHTRHVVRSDLMQSTGRYRKRDGEYWLHYWGYTQAWIVAGTTDFKDQTGRGWGVLENSTHVDAALSGSTWQVLADGNRSLCVQAFAYGL